MYEKRIKELTSDYKNRVVSVVVIMGNDPKAIRFRELDHTDLSDTFAEMKIRAACRHFNYPYLYDGDTQKVALQYGPTATPHAFVFDEQRILRYQGRVDNNPREELVTKREARDAIDSLLAGNPVAAPVTPAVGCSTKWPYNLDPSRISLYSVKSGRKSGIRLQNVCISRSIFTNVASAP
jgi:hypothetical protein